MNSASELANISTIDEGLHLATSDIRFKRILLGTDFSKPAEQGLRTAVAISQLFSSKLFLVHAASLFIYEAGTEAMPPEAISANLDAAKEQLKTLVSSKPALRSVQPKAIVAYAGAVDLICQVAREERVDLIILGSHGASGLERLALGSVAEAVLRKAPCPVMILGPNCKAEQKPFRSILFATDLEATGLRGAQYASALAEHVDGKLTFLHVINPRPVLEDADSKLIQDRIKQQLQQLLPPHVEGYCKAKVRVEYGDPAAIITAVARSEGASLVVVGLQNRLTLADHAPWSTLSHVIREANCAVIGIRGHLV